MARLLLLLICFVVVYLGLSASTSIECEYKTFYWNIVQNSYYCFVNNDPSITTQETVTITSVTGNHKSGKTNSDVHGFYVDSKTCHYFPRGLETFFKNLKAIQIYNTKLKEVHQEDLKPFPKLVELYLNYNSLEVLEEGLLDFNPDLEFINFQNNEIIQIEPNVFDHLIKLKTLYLSSNTCIDKYALNSISDVKNVIEAAKSQCINSEFSSLKAQLEYLEKESKIINSEDFVAQMAPLKSFFKTSKFINFRPLNYKFKALMDFKINDVILLKTSKIDEQLGNMTDLVTKVSMDVNDLKSSQINLLEIKGVKSSIDILGSKLSDLKSGQSNLEGSINNVCTKDSLTQVYQSLLNSQNNLKSSLDTLTPTINATKTDISNSIRMLDLKTTKLESSINQQSQSILKTLKFSKNEILGAIDKDCPNISAHVDALKKSNDQKLSNLNTNINALKSTTDQGLTTFNVSINTLDSKVISSVDQLKAMQEVLKNSIDNLDASFKSAQDQAKISQDDMRSSIGDIEASLSGLKSSQNEFKLTINKIRNSQNEVKVLMDEQKVQQDDSADDKFKSYGDEIKGQLKDVEDQLAGFKADLSSTRHKIVMEVDEKIKGIEKRLMKKFGEMLEEKLGKLIVN